jgi:hypothetical protein
MNRIYNTDSYFIISGEHQQFMSFFRSISKVSGQFNIVPTTDNISDPIGFYTKWFKFSDKKDQFKKIIIKKETDKNYKELYDEFLSTYKLRNLSKLEKNSLPNYIMTECVAMTPIFIGAPLSHLVGIWKVY